MYKESCQSVELTDLSPSSLERASTSCQEPKVRWTRQALVHRAITTGSMLVELSLFRDGWLCLTRGETPSHQVLHVMINEAIDQNNILMRLERFFGLAHRNVETFIAMNDALVSLHRAVGQEISDCCIPVNYTFLRGEFDRFTAFIPGNDEIANILRNLCVTLERTNDGEITRDVEKRESICDPSHVKTMDVLAIKHLPKSTIRRRPTGRT